MSICQVKNNTGKIHAPALTLLKRYTTFNFEKQSLQHSALTTTTAHNLYWT